jgi:hypothetical protein
MTKKDEIVSNEITTTVSILLSPEQREQLRRYLNFHYLGDVDVNELDENGFYVAKYPEKETEEFKNAIRRVDVVTSHDVELTYDVNGNCKLEVL